MKLPRLLMATGLRTRMVIAFLFVALIPIGVLIYMNDQAVRQALTVAANETLLAAARQSATTIDSFIVSRQDGIRAEAQEPALVLYASMTPEERLANRQAGLDAAALLRTLIRKDVENQPYLVSYALLDVQGCDIADTYAPDVGKCDATPDYYREPMRTGLPYVSPVLFGAGTREAGLYFASPIKDWNGRRLGVLRLQYDASVLQRLMDAGRGSAGADSFGILLDENYLRLASGGAPDLRFKMLVPLPEDQRLALQAAGRLPPGEDAGAASGSGETARALAGAAHASFAAPLTDAGGRQVQASAATLKSKPWTVIFAQLQATFLLPIEQQLWNALFASLLVAIAVLVFAIVMAHMLSAPIVRLTRVAQLVEGGNLNAQATVESAREIRALATAFNRMTDQLRLTMEDLEKRVTERTQALVTNTQVARRLSTLRDEQQLFAAVVEEVQSAFDYYAVQVFRVDETAGNVVLASGSGEPGHSLRIGQGLVGRAAERNEVFLVPDVSREPGWLPNPALPETRAEIAVPIARDGKAVGVIDVQHNVPGYLTETSGNLLRAIADQVAVAQENALLYRQARQALDEVSRLYATIGRIATAHSLNDLVSAVVEELHVEAIDRAELVMFERDNEGNIETLRVAGNWHSGRGTPPLPVGTRIPANRFPTLPLVFSRAPFFSEKLVLDDTVPHETRAMPKWLGPGVFAAMPLWAGDASLGTLLCHGDERHAFTPAERRYLPSLMGQMVVAVENRHLFEQMQKRAVELETVVEVSTTATMAVEAGPLLQTVVDLARQGFGLYHAQIYLFDAESGLLRLAAGAGEVGRAMVAEGLQVHVGLEPTPVAQAARALRGIIVNDTRQAFGFVGHRLLPGARSELAVPMIVSGKYLLGVFDVLSEQVNHFGKEDVRILGALAGQIAVALQNVRLYAEQSATVVRLRELDHLKSTFLATMSHELRTPLNGIIGFTQIILKGIDGQITPEMREDLETILSNGTHLLELINDILDMTKIESGRMQLRQQDFDLASLLEEVCQMTSALAQQKGLELSLAAPPGLRVHADRTRVRQVLLNLVGNSLKFTERGGVRLDVALSPDEAHVLVGVRDTGIGIQPENLESVFEQFHQIDSATTRKPGGTGLGLPISRRLIEMHGGKMWCESEGVPGKGSTFYFTLARADLPAVSCAPALDGAHETAG